MIPEGLLVHTHDGSTVTNVSEPTHTNGVRRDDAATTGFHTIYARPYNEWDAAGRVGDAAGLAAAVFAGIAAIELPALVPFELEGCAAVVTSVHARTPRAERM